MRGHLILALLVAAHPGAVKAQALTFAAGPSIPQGPMGERRALGRQLALAITPTHRGRGFTLRAEITQGWFPRRDTPQTQGEGVLSVGSALGYLLYSTAPGAASFHVGIGAGAYEMSIPGRPNPYGLVPGIGLVAGLRLGRGRVRGLVELQQQAILSDYGNGDFEASTFIPIRFGVSVQASH